MAKMLGDIPAGEAAGPQFPMPKQGEAMEKYTPRSKSSVPVQKRPRKNNAFDATVGIEREVNIGGASETEAEGNAETPADTMNAREKTGASSYSSLHPFLNYRACDIEDSESSNTSD